MRYPELRSIIMVFLLLLTIPELLCCQVNKLSENEYYSGSAEGKDLNAVRASAMDNLIQQIQVFVSSSNTRTLTESNFSLKDSSSLKTIMKSSIQLKGVGETVTDLKDGGFRVIKFVSRKTVGELFERRKAAIRDYLCMAEGELNKNTPAVDLGFVLKNFYRAYLLSLITQDTLFYTFHFDPDKPAYSTSGIIPAIQSAIKFVVSNISLTPKKKLETESLTWKYSADYRGRAIDELKFSYFDGIGEMMGVVNKGEAVLEFYFKAPALDRELVLSADISYEDEMDDELQQAGLFLGGKLGSWEFRSVIPAVGEEKEKMGKGEEGKKTVGQRTGDEGQGTGVGRREKRDGRRGTGDKRLETSGIKS